MNIFSWDFWVVYLVGALLTCGLLSAWFNTNFPQHLWNAFRANGTDEVYTKDDLLEAAINRFGAFGDLWACPTCLGTWFSVVISNILFLVYPLEFKFVIISIITWPYLYRKLKE